MFSKEVIETDNLPLDNKLGAIYSINQSSVNSYTHGFFKYPCKFIPEIPRWAIKKYVKDKDESILDPFTGSGTTLLEAAINGNNSYGIEIDEVAKLISRVKTEKYNKKEVKSIQDEFEKIISEYDNIKEYRVPEIDNLEHWFPKENIQELGKILQQINEIDNVKIKNFFKVCFVSIIKKCSYTDDSSPKPYVSSKIKKIPANPKDEFIKIYNKYYKGIEDLAKIKNFGEVEILKGDALNFELETKVNLVITSPPYINAFDYGRTMRLENLWLGLLTENELRDKKKDYVGTEKIKTYKEKEDLSILKESEILEKVYKKIVQSDEKRALIVKKFFDDMKTNYNQVKKCLNKDGHYVIVIGDSNIRQVKVKSSEILTEIAINNGFILEDKFSYIIKNPYINIPRNGIGGKINIDNVIVLRKEE
ncbi:MAG: modification methylase [Coprobacillus sp. 28_7]|nr:MAG: modification methylase [Coprobacillus sp. 28_7]